MALRDCNAKISQGSRGASIIQPRNRNRAPDRAAVEGGLWPIGSVGRVKALSLRFDLWPPCLPRPRNLLARMRSRGVRARMGETRPINGGPIRVHAEFNCRETWLLLIPFELI
jgi:hypothetical protein